MRRPLKLALVFGLSALLLASVYRDRVVWLLSSDRVVDFGHGVWFVVFPYYVRSSPTGKVVIDMQTRKTTFIDLGRQYVDLVRRSRNRICRPGQCVLIEFSPPSLTFDCWTRRSEDSDLTSLNCTGDDIVVSTTYSVDTESSARALVQSILVAAGNGSRL